MTSLLGVLETSEGIGTFSFTSASGSGYRTRISPPHFAAPGPALGVRFVPPDHPAGERGTGRPGADMIGISESGRDHSAEGRAAKAVGIVA